MKSAQGREVPFAAMILLFVMFGHSMSFCDNAGISTSVCNFPQHKGSAVGLMKAMEGLTAAVINTVFYSFCSDQQLNYFPLWIAAITLGTGGEKRVNRSMCQLCNRTETRVFSSGAKGAWTGQEEDEARVSWKFSILMVALLVYTAFCAVVVYFKAYVLPVAVVAVLLPLGLFLLTASGAPSARAATGRPLLQEQEISERPNVSAWEMLLKLDFYLLFLAFVAIQGAGLCLSNNFSQIVKAPGTLRHPEPFRHPDEATLMTLAFLLLHLGEALLAVSAALVGFALGGSFALQAVLVEEVFGPKVRAPWAQKQGRAICLGARCFGVTFTVTATCNFLAALAILTVALRASHTYAILNPVLQERGVVSTEAARL
eukprot:g852.t1